ncbi:hypothetical protein D3C81_1672160 [compost metagenome]
MEIVDTVRIPTGIKSLIIVRLWTYLRRASGYKRRNRRTHMAPTQKNPERTGMIWKKMITIVTGMTRITESVYFLMI